MSQVAPRFDTLAAAKYDSRPSETVKKHRIDLE